MEKLPVIDMRGFADGAFEPITAEIAKACRGIGFFYVVNHGVAPDLMRAAFAEARAFFAEPVAAKAALAIERVGGNRGYSGLEHEALDPKAGADLKEAFNIGLELAAGRSRADRRRPVSHAQRLARRAGLQADAARLFRRLLGPRQCAAPRLRQRPRPSPRLLPRQARSSDGDAASAALSRLVLGRPDRRGRTHGLRQHHAARDRRRRRPRGAHRDPAIGSPRRRFPAPSSSTSAIA